MKFYAHAIASDVHLLGLIAIQSVDGRDEKEDRDWTIGIAGALGEDLLGNRMEAFLISARQQYRSGSQQFANNSILPL